MEPAQRVDGPVVFESHRMIPATAQTAVERGPAPHHARSCIRSGPVVSWCRQRRHGVVPYHPHEHMSRIQKIADDLVVIDLHYDNTAQVDCAYLILGPQPALVETGPTATLENLLAGVREAGLDPAALQAVAVTHIHLDHAGGAGALVQRFPHLQVYVHPIGAPHLIDPTKLVASATRLYGDDMGRLFGDVIPIPADRVRVLADGETVQRSEEHTSELQSPLNLVCRLL